MTGFHTAADLLGAAGRDLGTSGWVEVDAVRRDRFAAATGDPGWHSGVPGTLLLGLLAPVLGELFQVPGAAMGVNYGVDDVRFGAPVPVGSRIRARVRIESARDTATAVAIALGVVVERDGEPEPVCTATVLARFHFPAEQGAQP